MIESGVATSLEKVAIPAREDNQKIASLAWPRWHVLLQSFVIRELDRIELYQDTNEIGIDVAYRAHAKHGCPPSRLAMVSQDNRR